MSFYVRREQIIPCANGVRVSTCYHVPRCSQIGGVFGRLRTGWTGPIRNERQAQRERGAWDSAGWTARVVPSSATVRAEVRAWEAGRQS
jgi:hypothetical protein